MALTLSDGIRDATEEATGMAGGLPAALVSLAEWADGRSVEVLAEAMRVSHSRAVRVVDRLEAAGLARRESDPSDGRRALVWLEPAGRELAERALDARSRVLRSAVARARCRRRARPRASARGAARCDDRQRACGEGDVPALRRSRLRALRRGLPGEPGRRLDGEQWRDPAKLTAGSNAAQRWRFAPRIWPFFVTVKRTEPEVLTTRSRRSARNVSR